MSTRSKTTLNLRYRLKPSARDAMLAELHAVLDLCAQEPEFITAIIQETPDRPDEVLIFEVWRGTREDFARVQGPKPYRKDYLARSKQHVESVEAVFSEPSAERGTSLLSQ